MAYSIVASCQVQRGAWAEPSPSFLLVACEESLPKNTSSSEGSPV